MVGLASLVQSQLRLDPFSGMLFIFRARRADRIKLLVWDGTGLVLVTKRLQDGKFRWPRPGDGVMKLSAATRAITDKLLTARTIASDETTTRTNGVTHWQWAFLSDKAVLHRIAPRRARDVAEEVLGGHQPDVWVSDRYAGQQELGKEHQVCLAHVLRDVQYAIDCGDTAFAPRIRDHLRWAIRVGKRRDSLKNTTLAAYAAKADNTLTRLMRMPIAASCWKGIAQADQGMAGQVLRVPLQP